jgi:hypothetical protein
VIATRFSTVVPSATLLVVIVASSVNIAPSRKPRPDGAKKTSTAKIAPTALVPPRNAIESTAGSPPTARTRKKSAAPPTSHVKQ